MKNLKKTPTVLVATFYLLLSTFNSSAQNVGINATGAAPNKSAMLDLNTGTDYSSPNGKGLLIPNVALTGTTDAVTVTVPATSLLVYNTATVSDVTPGYYYWDGAKWLRLLNTGNASSSTAWALLGNAGTVDGTNFIGTTDNIPFNIRVNNQKAGRISSAGMTFLGYQAGNSNTAANTGIGFQALYSNTTGVSNTANGRSALYSNTTGNNNTANGRSALYSNTTGGGNTANGENALLSNTTGNYNTANGVNPLYDNTTGSSNIAIGVNALYSNTTGNNNTGIGLNALSSNTTGGFNIATGGALPSNTTGNFNIANGQNALYDNTTGSYNIAIGVNALYSNTTEGYNTAIGQNALYDNTTGSNNIGIGLAALSSNTTGGGNTATGYGADVSTGNLTNATAIGSSATVNASNKVRLGNTTVTTIEGQVAYTFPSDGRFKFNVNEDVKGLDFIDKLRPVTYQFNTKKFDEFLTKNMPDSVRKERSKGVDYSPSTNIVHTGFIAQEVEKAATESGFTFDGVTVPEDENGNYGVAYSQFVVPLVKAVQELKAENDKMKVAADSKQSEIDKMKADYDSRIKALEQILEKKTEK